MPKKHYNGLVNLFTFVHLVPPPPQKKKRRRKKRCPTAYRTLIPHKDINRPYCETQRDKNAIFLQIVVNLAGCSARVQRDNG